MNNEHPRWLYDETRHVGVNYADFKQAQVYDTRHQSFRDYKAMTSAIVQRFGLGPDSTVLDLATGTGAFAIEAAAYCKHVYAVDISGVMLERCRAKIVAAGLTNVTARVGGFLTYEHKAEPVDAVVSIIALHHLPDF